MTDYTYNGEKFTKTWDEVNDRVVLTDQYGAQAFIGYNPKAAYSLQVGTRHWSYPTVDSAAARAAEVLIESRAYPSPKEAYQALIDFAKC